MRRIDQGQKKVALKLDKKAGEEEMHAIMKACREVGQPAAPRIRV